MSGTSLIDLSLFVLMVPVFVSLLIGAILFIFAAYDYTCDWFAARRDRRCTTYAAEQTALADDLERLWLAS